MGIASAMSKDATFDPLAIVDDSHHVILQGTSMAAPHVTGAVALLFDRTATLTPAEVRSVMTSTAYTDVYTGAVPNYDFGYGKLNANAMASYTAARFWNLYE
jgi:subtilisin family serine protease